MALLPDDWACWMRAESMAERTITERTRIVACAGRRAGVDPSELTTRQVVAYLANQPSAATRQTYYGALRAWHRWLTETGVRPDDPTLGVRRPRAPRRRPKPVATTHLEKVLASGIRGRTRAGVLLCSMQGLRVHEAAKVQGEDFDLDAETFRVVGKGGVEEVLPLHPAVAAIVSDFPRTGFWFPSYAHPDRPVRRESLSAAISRAMKRAGVPGTAHSLRHWHATELVRSGVNVRVVQTLMRHASLATTALYVQVDQDQQRAALALLPQPRALDALAIPPQREERPTSVRP